MEQNAAQIFESLTAAFLALDKQWQIIRVNQAALDYVKKTLLECLGQDFRGLFPELSRSMYYKYFHQAMVNKEVARFEVRSITWEAWFEVHLYPAQAGILVYFYDITARKEKEGLAKEMLSLEGFNLVGEMAAGLAHEIRNPLTTVRGFLQLYKSKRNFLKERERFDLMIGELDKANAIISDLLLLARNRIVRLKLQSLNSIIETVCLSLQRDAGRRKMTLKLDLTVVPDILLDEREISRLIINLARNGFEAMAPGGNLTISTCLEEKEVVLSVRDEGRGMAPAILKNLGMPFITTKRDGGGLALGLATCFSIAARHEGKINVVSGSGGTTVYVRFSIRSGRQWAVFPQD